MKNKILITIVFALAGLFMFSMISGFKASDAKDPWVVPDVAKNKRNPVAADAQTIATGKSLYSTHCKSCHGTKGLGDGSKAAQLKTEPGDFSKATFQAQTDGSLFYKTSEGRDDMPGFKKKIPDEDDRWSVVNFMRTLKK